MAERWLGTARAVAVSCTALLLLAGCTTTSTGPTGAQPPTPGSVTQTVPAVTPPTPIKRKLVDEARIAGVLIKVRSVQSVQVDSKIPGDGAGPGLAFSVELRNDNPNDYRTVGLEASVTDAEGNAASQVTGPPAKGWPELVGSGASAEATLVFLLPAEQRKPVTLRVSVAAGQQPAEFVGNP